jgi:hypothetical protein
VALRAGYAGGDGEQRAEQRGGERERQRVGVALQDEVQHGVMQTQRAAQVAVQQAASSADTASLQWSVEAVASGAARRCRMRLRRRRASARWGRRERCGSAEDDGDDHPQHRQCGEDALQQLELEVWPRRCSRSSSASGSEGLLVRGLMVSTRTWAMRWRSICCTAKRRPPKSTCSPSAGMWPSLASRKPARVSTPASRGNFQRSCVTRSRRLALPSSSRPPSLAGSGRLRRGVELVFQFADDLLEDVFRGDQAERGAELVDDDGDLAAALLELLQQLDGELGLGHQQTSRMTWRSVMPEVRRCRLGDGAEVHEARDVLGVDDADDVVAAAAGS